MERRCWGRIQDMWGEGVELASGNRLAMGEGQEEDCNKLENMLGSTLLGRLRDMLVGVGDGVGEEEVEEVEECSS